MKKGLLIFIILIISLRCGYQNKSEPISDKETFDSSIERWITTADDSTQLSIEKRKEHLKNALSKIEQIGNDTIVLGYLSSIALAYKKLKDSSNFRTTNKRVFELSQELNDFKTLGESHWDMASFMLSYSVMDSSYYYYRKAHKSFEQLPTNVESLSLKARMLYNMGRVQDHFKDYLGAEISITEALRVFEDLEDYRMMYNCNNVLGVIASGMNYPEKSIEYYQKAGRYIGDFKTPNIDSYLWQNQNNIANMLLISEEYSKAIVAYKKLLSNKNLSLENPELYSLANVSQAYALLKEEGKYNHVGSVLKEAIKFNDSTGFLADQSRTKRYLAELLAIQGDTINAKQYAMESYTLAKETSNTDSYLNALRLLTHIDSQNAVAYSDEFYELSEQIKDEERAIRDKFARIRLETDEVIQENELLSRQKQIWIAIALGVVLAGIALFTIISQRISNNRLKFQQKQQESNQEIYNLMLSQQGKFEEGKQLEKKRISEELHDGILGEMLGIRLILSGLNDKEDEASIAHRAELIEKLRELEEEIRTLSHELSDASYQKFYNFIVSLEELIYGINRSSGIDCSFTYDNGVEWDDLEGDIKINAYRIVQESLQNCVKHAQCKQVTVDFRPEGNQLQLTISDDGVGFDIGKGKRGIGLRNVTSRVKKIKGTLAINSKKGEGTTILVRLPYSYIKVDNQKDVMERRHILNV